jgi:hypothetical protein
MGLWSMWAFVGPKYQNAPDDVTPVSQLYQAPAQRLIV